MLTYSLGECANSLVMNGIFGFAMLFYTKSLGLDPTWAGLAMSLSVFWEAVTEPVMGHVSDHTRSRWGRRHPYMLVGGLLMALCSYLIWTVPGACRGSQMAIFWYLVAMNLLLRTGLTLFFTPTWRWVSRCAQIIRAARGCRESARSSTWPPTSPAPPWHGRCSSRTRAACKPPRWRRTIIPWADVSPSRPRCLSC